jgi:hypothetical protein
MTVKDRAKFVVLLAKIGQKKDQTKTPIEEKLYEIGDSLLHSLKIPDNALHVRLRF